MREHWKRIFARGVTALFAALFVFSLGFAGTSSTDVSVADADELVAALEAAGSDSGTVNITWDSAISSISLGSSASIPANAVINLALTGGTLRITGGTLSVSGSIVGGAVEVAGGTLVRSGGSITASITVSSGSVRGARVLTLENMPASSSENIVSITYRGISDEDISSFVTRAASGTIYPLMTGSGYNTFAEITSVTTDAGCVYRLGTRNTTTLSLAYVIAYAGLDGAVLASANPGNYTASDSAITLNNPTKEGYLFQGWTCAQLGIAEPAPNVTIAEGTTGALTFVANWIVNPAGGMGGGGGSGGASSAAAAATQDDTTASAAATPAPTTTDAGTTSTRRVKTASSSTKVTFSSEVDVVEPTIESVRGNSFPWGWSLLGVGGAAAIGYAIALISRKHRENQKTK